MRWAILLLFVIALPLQAGDQIWSAVVLATNETPPRTPPRALEEFAPSIQTIFGYNSVYLVGQKKRALSAGADEWLIPSEKLFFQVTTLAQERSHYLLRIGLFREKELLLCTEARLARDAPLYIRGPQWGAGQLILLLEVR